jgi:pimeloyl-ACP methyl ester carboxylesterase
METDCLEELSFGTLSTLEVCGTAIELFTAGQGAPLLFLHGLDGLEGSAGIMRELAKDFTVYAPSHPGFGGSARGKNTNRVDDLGYFYLDMLGQQGIENPVIAGISFGGWVATEILTKEPARASRLVLVSPLGLATANRRESHVADVFMLSRQELGARMQVSEPAAGSDMGTLVKLPEERLRRLMRNDEAASVYGWTPYMANPKLGDRLHRITTPTLLIWGEEDAILSPQYRSLYEAALPQAEAANFRGSGHRVHADAPAELAAHITAFARTGDAQ